MGLIKNGGFEDVPTYNRPFTPNKVLADWQVTGSIDVIESYWVSAEGNRSLDLNSLFPGSITQNFVTIPGKEYKVSFWFAGNPRGLPLVKTLEVSAADKAEKLSFDTSQTNFEDMQWQEESLQFKAKEETTELTFSSLVGTAQSYSPYGVALDDVRVTPVGEGRIVLGLVAIASLIVLAKQKP